jgi:hypothetical protein
MIAQPRESVQRSAAPFLGSRAAVVRKDQEIAFEGDGFHGSAISGRAKLRCRWIDRSEVVNPVDIEQMCDANLID